LTELAEIGVLQIHFSGGGRPRAGSGRLVQHASDVGLYGNLITSAVLLTKKGCRRWPVPSYAVCRSVSGQQPMVADRVAGLKNAHDKKIEAAKWTRELELPLTVNAVMHVRICISFPTSSDGGRSRRRPARGRQCQYYGWALRPCGVDAYDSADRGGQPHRRGS
jgi:pyrroloquinoline quinone biosynthesis protein E